MKMQADLVQAVLVKSEGQREVEKDSPVLERTPFPLATPT